MSNSIPLVSCLTALGLVLTGCESSSDDDPSQSATTSGDDQLTIGLLLAGDHDDGGFMQAGYEGVERAVEEFDAEFDYVEGVKPEKSALEKSLRELAQAEPDLVIAHGGQNSDAIEVVAKDFPNVEFAITQSHVTGDNLASYEVLQEESAWLAGAAAGLLTESDVVGHMSGIRVTPGLKGRAAYIDGVHHTNPQATVLTNFSGDQDDVDLAEKVARAEIDKGADYIFTMLNAGRPGVAEAMKGSDVRQFGNVIDWVRTDPDVFVGSAVADSSVPAYLAVQDVAKGTFEPGKTETLGLGDEGVSLTLAPDVPSAVSRKVESLRKQIVKGDITVSTDYYGPEFPTPT